MHQPPRSSVGSLSRCMVSIEVEIVGGPRDGDVIVLPEGSYALHMAVPNKALMDALYEEYVQDIRSGYRVHEVRMPIKLTRDGYKAYWREPC